MVVVVKDPACWATCSVDDLLMMSLQKSYSRLLSQTAAVLSISFSVIP